MVTIPSAIPSALGGPGSSTSLSSNGISYDVAIGGIPFCSAISGDNPYVRESAPVQKQQFDTGSKAGERSLGDWWRRSQASFHGGAGLKYAEPDGPQDPTTDIRYFNSKNLDVWTPGQVTRLPDTTLIEANGSAITGLATGTLSSTNYVLFTFGSTLRSWNGAAFTNYNWLGTGTILSLAVDGQRYYVADNTGIYSGPIDGSVTGTKLYVNTATRVKLAWVKQRLMAGVNNTVRELDSAAAAAALPAAKYTHPNSGWTWTDFAGGPASIMVSGYSGAESTIQEFVLATDGTTPTLVSGQTHDLPTGEICYSLFAYVGSFLGMGTSKGIRVGQFDANGGFAYGALSVETVNPVRSITGRDHYLYATATGFIETESCLIRLDLGQPLDRAGRFAYAPDLICATAQTANASWVAITATGKLTFSVDGYGPSLEGTGPGSGRSAWLETARIRMGTSESKLFRRIQVRGSFPSPGTVSVTITGGDGQVTVAMPPISSTLDLDDLSGLTAPQEWVSLRFDLNSASTIDFRGYVLKALSAVRPRRLYQLPLSLRDHEKDRNDVAFGYPGLAISRLLQLEALEDARDEVLLELFTSQGALTRLVTIEQVSFRQIHQPGKTGTVAGVVVVTLKTVQ